MNLYDLRTPLHLMSREEATLFIRELRFQRTLDHSPPKKEKEKRKTKKELLLESLEITEEQLSLLAALIQTEKENGTLGDL
jgi:hypothetical protein